MSLFKNFSNKGGFLKNSHPSVKQPCRSSINQNKLGPLGPVLSSKKCGNSYVTNPNVNVPTPGQIPTVTKLFPTNPVSVGQTAVQLMLPNPGRTKLQVINIGTSHIYGGCGRIPTATSYDFALAACTTANDGTGGVYIDEEFNGAVWTISDTSFGVVSIFENP